MPAFDDYHDIATRFSEKHGYDVYFEGFYLDDRQQSVANYCVNFDSCCCEGERVQRYKYLMPTLDGKLCAVTVTMPDSTYKVQRLGLEKLAFDIQARCNMLVAVSHL